MSKKALPPVHPGETSLEDLMKPLGLSQNKLAEIQRKVKPRPATQKDVAA